MKIGTRITILLWYAICLSQNSRGLLRACYRLWFRSICCDQFHVIQLSEKGNKDKYSKRTPSTRNRVLPVCARACVLVCVSHILATRNIRNSIEIISIEANWVNKNGWTRQICIINDIDPAKWNGRFLSAWTSIYDMMLLGVFRYAVFDVNNVKWIVNVYFSVISESFVF